jgi:NAD-dependent dihydropyrimidine dehydrogenase PreA subunit
MTAVGCGSMVVVVAAAVDEVVADLADLWETSIVCLSHDLAVDWIGNSHSWETSASLGRATCRPCTWDCPWGDGALGEGRTRWASVEEDTRNRCQACEEERGESQLVARVRGWGSSWGSWVGRNMDAEIGWSECDPLHWWQMSLRYLKAEEEYGKLVRCSCSLMMF